MCAALRRPEQEPRQRRTNIAERRADIKEWALRFIPGSAPNLNEASVISKELRCLFRRFKEQRFQYREMFHRLLLTIVQEFRQSIDGIKRPRTLRHFKIDASIPLLSDKILRLEVRSL